MVGIFEPSYSDINSAAKELQNRVPAIGFIHEKNYIIGEINSNIILYAHPESNTRNIREIWPLLLS